MASIIYELQELSWRVLFMLPDDVVLILMMVLSEEADNYHTNYNKVIMFPSG